MNDMIIFCPEPEFAKEKIAQSFTHRVNGMYLIKIIGNIMIIFITILLILTQPKKLHTHHRLHHTRNPKKHWTETVRGASSRKTMASRASKIAAVAREIFGTLPIRGVRTGLQFLKKPLTGAYEARYYMEPIEPFARKVRAIVYLFCLCDRTGCLG